MSTGDGRVHCREHWSTGETYVCGHLVHGIGLGFYAAYDPGNPRPDAWCGDCERLRLAFGGEWPEEVERSLGVSLLCGECYDRVRARNALAQ